MWVCTNLVVAQKLYQLTETPISLAENQVRNGSKGEWRFVFFRNGLADASLFVILISIFLSIITRLYLNAYPNIYHPWRSEGFLFFIIDYSWWVY